MMAIKLIIISCTPSINQSPKYILEMKKFNLWLTIIWILQYKPIVHLFHHIKHHLKDNETIRWWSLTLYCILFISTLWGCNACAAIMQHKRSDTSFHFHTRCILVIIYDLYSSVCISIMVVKLHRMVDMTHHLSCNSNS